MVWCSSQQTSKGACELPIGAWVECLEYDCLDHNVQPLPLPKAKVSPGWQVSSETSKNQNSIPTYILSHEAFWIFSGEFCDVTQLGATRNGNLIGSFCTFRTFRAFQHQHPVAVRPVSADVGGPAPLSLLAAVAMVRGSPWRRQLRGSRWRLYRGEVVQLERNLSVHLGWYDKFRSLISPNMLQRSHY